ncbi:LCP family protein [Paenibacillus pasadenensis]|uniref:Cell envelope-associated transcriptional attenuator LytR-CpsA-Psr, subfamily A1 n=1 Tax=Paenibacillus pasadenensis TaxID=217090 RepID=A0A2N5NC78_9BACL|nr:MULTISPECIES: LCP family protein [Paenibacillus]PLT47966.1 Cell envelope-associated transcriptional attenuator LytR-CpsA-Psr, subfamily A1 [Paenibacillus pasadenensis]QGG58453.1 LytR family transcriptional regulator [Paenibacillus sp. B01]
MKPKKSRARKAWTWTASVLALLLVLGAAGYYNRTTLALWGFDLFLAKDVEKQLEKSYKPTVDSKPKPPAAEQIKYTQADPYSVLLLGVDARDAEQGRSDTIMYTVIRPKEGAILMVSIPRDTYAELVGRDREDKINHAYAFGGAKMAIDTVENLLGSEVDYYAAVNFNGFKNLIDAMGGISLPIEEDIVNKDPGHEKFTIKAGQDKYMGQDALNFVRYREDAGGDVSRTERQQTFVESIMDEASSMSSWSKIPEYVGIMGENFATDIPPSEMIEMAKAMMQGKNRSIYTHTLKGEGGKLASNGAWYYFADEEDVAKSKTLIEDWMNPAKSLAELTGTGASAADKQDVAGSGKDREVSTASAGADE